MNNWMDYAKAAADMAATLTKQYGPEAWETILRIQRIDALSDLAPSIVVLAVLAAIAKWFAPIVNAWCETCDDPQSARVFTLYIPSVLAGILAICCLVDLFQIWTWVQLFKPDLYLAKQLIDKVIN